MGFDTHIGAIISIHCIAIVTLLETAPEVAITATRLSAIVETSIIVV